MNGRPLLIVALIALGLVAVSQSFYEVQQTELALRLRFRDIVGVDDRPGAKLKLPFIETVQFFEKRVMTRSYATEEFLTSEGKILKIDFYVKWRIADVGQYYRATGGSDEAATGRLSEIVKDGLKGTIARRTIQQVVAAERAEFIQDVLSFASNSVKELGIALVDVRVKRIDLPDEVSESVFKRMQSDFARQAALLRAEGDEQAIRIRADADRQRTEILANASRDAERMRGEGDAAAAEIYSRVYQKNPEFYAFHRSLAAYRRALARDHEVLVLSPDSEFFRYMKQPGGGR
jgi:modulator of FtsH protease HflC